MDEHFSAINEIILQNQLSTVSTLMTNGQGGFGRDQFKTYANESWAIVASWFAAQGQRTNDRVEAEADRALRSG